MIISYQHATIDLVKEVYMFEKPIDEDIEKLSLPRLQQLYMRRREEARKAMETLSANGNDNCWDDMLKTVENLLPPNERKYFKLGKFNMCSVQILANCRKWIDSQKAKGNVLPDKKCSLE